MGKDRGNLAHLALNSESLGDQDGVLHGDGALQALNLSSGGGPRGVLVRDNGNGCGGGHRRSGWGSKLKGYVTSDLNEGKCPKVVRNGRVLRNAKMKNSVVPNNLMYDGNNHSLGMKVRDVTNFSRHA
jgi:hypothetical protein